MKALIVFLVVILLGFGFVELVEWLVAEPPMHVYHVGPDGKARLK